MLAVDQLADECSDNPALTKAVTLEVDALGAQKLSLASSGGSLSLSLRQTGEAEFQDTRRISIGDLGGAETAAPSRPSRHYATVMVTRAGQRQEYRVPVDGEPHAAATAPK